MDIILYNIFYYTFFFYAVILCYERLFPFCPYKTVIKVNYSRVAAYMRES